MFTKKGSFAILLLLILLVGCATTTPVRPALQEDISIPSGKIEGNQFTGIRYPFNVSAPPHWKMTTEFPDFLQELGYDKPSPTDKEQTELYAYNPETKSNIQFDFTPAGRYATFNQKKIEQLVTAATDSLTSEIEKDYGKVVKVEVGPTEPIFLKGVQFAAKKYATYTVRGVKREQGWIYGFTEPYQIFILYMILDKEGANDRQDMKKILDSFEVIQKR
jgi:DNA gyrase inhibitor GyrI